MHASCGKELYRLLGSAGPLWVAAAHIETSHWAVYVPTRLMITDFPQLPRRAEGLSCTNRFRKKKRVDDYSISNAQVQHICTYHPTTFWRNGYRSMTFWPHYINVLMILLCRCDGVWLQIVPEAGVVTNWTRKSTWIVKEPLLKHPIWTVEFVHPFEIDTVLERCHTCGDFRDESLHVT